MLFDKFTEGLEAVVFIASNAGIKPVASKEIANFQDTKPRHLEPTLQHLVKVGILKSSKGSLGGYSLAKEKRKITIWEIFSAIYDFSMVDFGSSIIDTAPRKSKAQELIRSRILNAITKEFSNETLEELCKHIDAKATKISENKTVFDI